MTYQPHQSEDATLKTVGSDKERISMLDELQRKAEAAPVSNGWYVFSLVNGSDVRARHITGGSTWIAECRTKEDAAYIAAADPQTVLRLIAVARAAKMLYDDTADYIRINNLGGMDNHSMKAVRESLAALEGVGNQEGKDKKCEATKGQPE